MYSLRLQVLFSILIICEDVHIGSPVIGRSGYHCSSKNTQFNLIYCGLGLNIWYCIGYAKHIDACRWVPHASQLLPKIKLNSYMHDVEEAIGFDSIENIPMPSWGPLEGLKCIGTQELSLIQLHNDLEENTLKCFTSPTPLSPDGLLWTMHSINPSPPTELRKGSTEGLGLEWLQRWSLQLDLPDLQQQCHHHARCRGERCPL